MSACGVRGCSAVMRWTEVVTEYSTCVVSLCLIICAAHFCKQIAGAFAWKMKKNSQRNWSLTRQLRNKWQLVKLSIGHRWPKSASTQRCPRQTSVKRRKRLVTLFPLIRSRRLWELRLKGRYGKNTKSHVVRLSARLDCCHIVWKIFQVISRSINRISPFFEEKMACSYGHSVKFSVD